VLFVLLAAAAVHAAPTSDATSLDAVLGNMDKASASFRGMAADVEWTTFTALVEDKSVEKGHMKVRRSGASDTDLYINFTDPYPKEVLIRGSKVEMYKPKIKTVEEYDLSDSKEKIDQALLIGFGASGKTIRKDYDAKLLGEEAVAGEPTAHLELIPKDAEARKSIAKFEMWVSTENWQTVQLKIFQDLSGDYRLDTYTNIELNPKLGDSDFALDLPKGVKRITPRKSGKSNESGR
jgi:outer membrane lipoprotein-sorting protein